MGLPVDDDVDGVYARPGLRVVCTASDTVVRSAIAPARRERDALQLEHLSVRLVRSP